MVSALARIDARPCSAERGFTYLGLLFAVAIAGIALAGSGVLWYMEGRREKEKELLFIGEEYRAAISSYYNMQPSGSEKQYPAKLEDLLLDKRFPMPVRHLRRLYRDPMRPGEGWELLLIQERIYGIASRSRDKPLKVAGFPPKQDEFSGAEHYSEWRFAHNAGQ